MHLTCNVAAARMLDGERRRQTVFISTLAHELRQPLAALRAAVAVERLASDSRRARRSIEVMERQIAQMNRLIDDLIDTSRWALGKVAIQKRRLDVRVVVTDAAVDVAPALTERGIDLRVDIPSEPLWADADPQRLQQVLSNLLRNAAYHTDTGGRISLAARRTAASVSLRVADNGRGIEPEALPHIFDIFSQVRADEAGGLGVGLSVVREIVDLHAGRVEARSGGLGRGSVFIVTLPVARDAVGPPATRLAPGRALEQRSVVETLRFDQRVASETAVR